VLAMLLREALRAGLQTLKEHEVPSPQLAAELLLMHTLGCDRGWLYSHLDEPVAPEVADRYIQLIAERSTGKPTQYITGHQEFWGLDFEVTPDVLIPRPETEHLVEAALELIRKAGSSEPCRIVDVGTGSGCIALALASELPQKEIHAVDISPAALEVARRNARRFGLARQIQFCEGDLLKPYIENGCAASFNMVVSNPPYVGDAESDLVQREVREFEPRLAWSAPGDGNGIYRRLFPQALELLEPGGHVVVEIGYLKSDAVTRLLGDGWTGVEVTADLAGIPRVVVAEKAPDAPNLSAGKIWSPYFGAR
jgi:release factor glutamine methyltransferase